MPNFHFVNPDTDEPLGDVFETSSRAACLEARERWGSRFAMVGYNMGSEPTLYNVLVPVEKTKSGRVGNLAYLSLGPWDEAEHRRLTREEYEARYRRG